MDMTRQKVQAEHLRRDAYLYVRQSSIQQVFQNTESTRRQYGLRRRAVALGWPEDRIVVIDCDLGQSGASAADRQGFQKLVAEVGIGRVGIVLGLEVSRLARNSSDWHRLLEICALTDTLILDEDGLYNPGDFNDRLLLGMKGTMSEAELHVLRARLQGGILNKASRGELRMSLPVGLSYDEQDRVILTPDKQIQEAMRAFFKAYKRTGSALAVVKWFRENRLQFPRVIRAGINRGKIVWAPLIHSRALQVLRNPRYGGAFVFGRTKTLKRPDGSIRIKARPMDQWHTLLPDSHPGYITWQEYQDNLKTLRACAKAHGKDRRDHPPGQGPALLQGRVVCGVCGQRMTVRYQTRNGQLAPNYLCQRRAVGYGEPLCQSIPGSHIDKAVRELLLAMVEPLTLELALSVQHEVQSRLQVTGRMRRQSVERAQYEADLARERFMSVDPRNRLVADQLEANWNEKLRTLSDARETYEQQRQKDRVKLDEPCRQKVLSLARDFPKVWNDPATTHQQKKRMIRLLIEDATLSRTGKHTSVQIRFRGGQTKRLNLPYPLSAGEARKTPEQIVEEIDRLLDCHTDRETADNLNRRGFKSSMGAKFNALIIAKLRRSHRLQSRYQRLRKAGLLTKNEMSEKLGVSICTIKIWQSHGLLKGHCYNNRGERLYELPPEEKRPVKSQGQKLNERRIYPISKGHHSSDQ
jgi:DNA invertase Pin-like site-specific DNA recombinase